jgi:hypothetical protein
MSEVEFLEREMSTSIADDVVVVVDKPLERGYVVELPPTPCELLELELDRKE